MLEVISHSFRLHMSKAKLRLIGIDTPEMREADPEKKKKAYAARDYVRAKILGKTVMIQSHGQGKYGRYLCTIWPLDEKGEPVKESLNDELIRIGHAKHYGEET